MAVVALFAAGTMASFVHLATVEHTRCLEHGELIDVSRDGFHERWLVADDPSLLPDDTPGSNADHLHCDLCPTSREQVVDSPDVLATLVAACPPQLVRFVPPALAPSAPLYRLAPKNSPPV